MALLPLLAMFVTQFCFGSMNVMMALVVRSGIEMQVFVTYRQIFATVAISPLAYFIETRPNLTWRIAMEIFLCSVLGATCNQLLYIWGMKYTTATVACAISNMLPAITFFLAVLFKMEKVGIRQRAGQAKLIGTIMCVGGAILLALYDGPRLNLPQSGIHWAYAAANVKEQTGNSGSILGPLQVFGSCVAWAGWFILQTKLSEHYPCPLSTSAVICFFSSLESAALGLIMDHTGSKWSLYPSIRLVSTIISGIVGSALPFCLMSWAISKKGPLYVSIFSPLLLVKVAVMSWALLDEKIDLGTLLGSVIIIVGVYAVLWAKKKEEEMADNGEAAAAAEDVVEV